MIDPKQMRKEILAARDRLSPEEITLKSTAIAANLLALDSVKKSRTIFLYVSFRSEVDTTGLLNTFLDQGKTVTVPITLLKENRLDAIHITEPATELVPGYCDIPEPRQDICTSRKVDPATIDLILLPGSVFDKRGGRFGYGGGYYDRFVSAIPAALRVGLAYDLQIVEKAPLQAHDELLDLVVTEQQVIQGSR